MGFGMGEDPSAVKRSEGRLSPQQIIAAFAGNTTKKSENKKTLP
jgi:hypothetical protein